MWLRVSSVKVPLQIPALAQAWFSWPRKHRGSSFRRSWGEACVSVPNVAPYFPEFGRRIKNHPEIARTQGLRHSWFLWGPAQNPWIMGAQSAVSGWCLYSYTACLCHHGAPEILLWEVVKMRGPVDPISSHWKATAALHRPWGGSEYEMASLLWSFTYVNISGCL